MKAMKGIASVLALALLLAVVLVSGAAPAAAQVATSEPAPPAVGQVTGLTASSEGMADGAVQVRWTAAEHAQAHIVVYIRSDDAAAGSYGRTQMAAFNGTEGIIDGLDAGVSYDFIAIGMRGDPASYGQIWGAWSNRVSATPGGTPPPGPSRPPLLAQEVGWITDLAVSAQGQQTGAVRVSWTAARHAQVYFVVYSRWIDDDVGEWPQVRTAVFNGTDGIIDGLDGGVSYKFAVAGMRMRWRQGGYAPLWGPRSEWRRAKAIGMPANLGAAAGDWEALIALYRATDGDNWNASYNWLSDAPLGEWYGVTTDQEGRVIRLVLGRWSDPAGPIAPFGPDLNLEGELPAELGNLTRLQELSLGVNQLVGEIPSELGRLSRLTTLDLNNNQLTGDVPPELGSLPNLQGLYLGNNALTGAIPAELGQLSNLQALDLRGNALTGSIPAELGNLSRLQRLSLGGNELTGAIPTELGNLSRLQRLRLAWNELTGAIPAELGNLSELRQLYLAANALTGEIPSELGELPNLAVLNLGGNRLTGCIPTALRASAGHYASDLSSLGLPWCEAAPVARTETDRAVLAALYRATDGPNWEYNDNWLSDAPVSEWSGVDADPNGQVKGLSLEGYGLTGVIPAALGSLANLETLHLGSNNLTGQIPPELGSLAHLELLVLNSNPLTGEIPPELGGLLNLRELHLNWNGLTGAIPTELGSLVNLRWLFLDRNELTGAIPTELGGLVNLRGLSLDRNKLTGAIPTELGSLVNLRWLSLDRNELTGTIPAELGNLSNLRELRLAGNALTGGIPSELGELPNLEVLTLSGNPLTGCIPAALRARANHYPADLSDLDLPSCEATPAVRTTEADRAVLENLYRATDGANWHSNDNWLSDAPVAEWSGVAVDRNGQVKGLNLEGNGLTGAIPAALGSLANLETLHLGYNNLTGAMPVELGNLSELRELHLAGNALTGEIPSELGELPNLEVLALSGNPLTGCIPEALRGVDSSDLAGLGLLFCPW